MTIESITLKNFQCYGETPTTIRLGELTALIGTNGAGKTAALQGLSRIFGASAGQRGLRRSDFHLPPRKEGEAPPKSISLTIDLRLSFPELAAGQAAGAAVPQCFQHMAIDREGGDPFCRILLEGTWYASNLADGEIEEHLWWVSSTDEVPKKEDKTAFSARERGLVHVLYVPATRDPAQEIRSASAALIGRLLNVIKWSKEVREEVATASENLDDIITSEDAIATIQDRLEERWQSLHNDALYAEPTMQFSVGELEDLLKRVQVVFGPTIGESHDHLDRLSDGMKSLFYFALVAAVFDVERQAALDAAKPGEEQPFDLERLAPPALTVLAVEEPENHVAPQLLGRIMELLRAVCAAPAGQVVITSHSPGIMSRVDPTEVRYLRLRDDATATRRTEVREITLPAATDEAYKYVKEAVRAYPELYFAQLVVLGEGDTEELVIPRLLRCAGIGLDAKAIAVVPLGGRHVRHLWRLLHSLAIPHVTLLDLDQERDGGDWGRIKTACKELLANGANPSPLLDVKEGTLTEEELDDLTVKIEDLQPWLDDLEKYNVYFSGPLDLDLMMLEAFTPTYQSLAVRGPRIPKPGTTKYDERMASATKAVLGDEGGDGTSYSGEQRALFPWYSYLFLGRGKPSTHILALSKLTDAELEAGWPLVLQRLRKRVIKKLSKA